MKVLNKKPPGIRPTHLKRGFTFALVFANLLLIIIETPGLINLPIASAAGSGTIRQEINLLDSTYTATNSTINSDEFSQLDPTKYSGTVSYYFEVVATASSGSFGNIHLRRKGTTTDDASIAASNIGTSATRYRSAAFTAPGSATEYLVNADAAGSGKTLVIKAARIIIIQTSSPMTSTETQLEIGTHATGLTNTSYQAVPYPKYWGYKASAWDNSPSFYAEVTYKTLNTSVAVWLQEDDTQFGSWHDKIVIAQDDTPSVRTRTAFTPVDGRHYRLATIMTGATGTYNYDLYSAKIVVDQTGTSMDPISKLQPQYLLGNTASSGATTGPQGYQTLYDPSEWSGTESYKFAMDSGGPFNAAQLADISNSNATVSRSQISGSYQPIAPQPQYVQGNYDYTGGNTFSARSVTLSSNVTAGDLIVVAVGAVHTGYTALISDNQGNTYSQAATAISSTIPYATGVYYTIAQSTGSLTVTHTMQSTNAQYMRLAVSEYKDIDSFDAASGNAGDSGGPDSGSFTTNHDDELIFGWGVSNNGITTAPFGFTKRQDVGSETIEDKTVASPGSYSAFFPDTGSAWTAIGAGFYKSGGLTLNMTSNHEFDTDITNSADDIAASRIIVDVVLPSSVVSVSVSDGNISYGTLGTGTSKDTTSGGLNDTQIAANDGTTAEDFNIKGQDTTNWTLASSAGTNQYKHEFCTSGSGSPDPCDSSPSWTALTTSYQSLGTNVAASGTKKFDLKLGMPNSTSNYSQQFVDVTIQAVEH